MAKKTLEQVKLEMDKRAGELRAIVSRPSFTEKKIYELRQRQQNLYDWERMSRSYEVIKYEDGEVTPEYLESQIEKNNTELSKQLEQAAKATFELKEMEHFYRAYNFMIRKGKIIKLEQDLEDMKNWAFQWREEMNALSVDPEKSIDEKIIEHSILMQNYENALREIEKLEKQLFEQKRRMHKQKS